MGGVDDVFIPQLRVGAGQQGDDIARGDIAELVLDDEGALGPERQRLKIAARGGGLGGGEILAAGTEETLGGLEGEPGLQTDVAGIEIERTDLKVFPAPRAHHDAEGIGGRTSLVDDETGGGPLGGGDLVFVGPAAVVGHGSPAKNLRVELAGRGIENRRIVDEHDDGLAAHVHALVIIPPKFRRDDAVAHENHVGVLRLHPGHEPARRADKVVDDGHRDRHAVAHE